MAFDTAPWLQWLPHPHESLNGEPYARRWLALIVVSLGVFLVALDVTVVGVVAPTLSRELGATAMEIQWVFDAYTVVLAGFVVLGGGLAERFGRKGWLQLGTLVFAAGASISAFAHGMNLVIAGRVISGLGAAVVFPACLSITSSLFGVEERQRAIGIFAAISAAGIVAGPLVGGFLIDWFWWGAAFLVVVPVSLLAIIAIAIIVPTSRGTGTGSLDSVGAILSVLGLGGLVFAVIEGPARGWTDPMVLETLVIGILGVVAFIAWELRVAAPLFDLRVFQDIRVVGGALAMAMVYFTFNVSQLLLPQYLVDGLGFSSMQTGLIMSPFGIALLLLSPRSSGLVERYGQRAMLVFSLSFMAAGMAVFALLPIWGGVVNVLVGMCVFGVGFGLIVAPATAAVMMALPKEKAGDGSAVNMVARQIGGAIGVAMAGAIAVLTYRAGLNLSGFSLSAPDTTLIEHSLSGVDALRGQLAPAILSRIDLLADAAMVKGVATALGFCALVTLLMAVIIFFALRKGEEMKLRVLRKILPGILILALLYGALLFVERMTTQELARATDPSTQQAVCLMWKPRLLVGGGLCYLDLQNARGKVLDTFKLGILNAGFEALQQFGQLGFQGPDITIASLQTGELAHHFVVRDGRLAKPE